MKMSDIVKETTEMTSASVATSMRGNGFLNGGIGDKPIKRVTKPKKKSKAKKKA
jgi:hypothetical protein